MDIELRFSHFGSFIEFFCGSNILHREMGKKAIQ